MNKKVFSIVLLSYNQEELLYDGIESILSQDYPYIQLIISDDASESLNVEALNGYIESNKKGNITEYITRVNKINLGIAANCDAAKAVCTGDYIMFLDGDDCLADNYAISRIVRAFDLLPEDSMVVTGNVLVCDTELNNGSLWLNESEIKEKNKMSAMEQFKALYTDFWVVPSATTYKRELFDRAGGFKIPENRQVQDGAMFLRLARMGVKFNVLDCIIAKHRAGGICYSEPDSQESICLREEILRIAEREVFPYSGLFTAEELDKVCGRYYENMIGYLVASDEKYLISEPTYSLVKGWADRNGIFWCYDKSEKDYCKLRKRIT